MGRAGHVHDSMVHYLRYDRSYNFAVIYISEKPLLAKFAKLEYLVAQIIPALR